VTATPDIFRAASGAASSEHDPRLRTYASLMQFDGRFMSSMGRMRTYAVHKISC